MHTIDPLIPGEVYFYYSFLPPPPLLPTPSHLVGFKLAVELQAVNYGYTNLMRRCQITNICTLFLNYTLVS